MRHAAIALAAFHLVMCWEIVAFAHGESVHHSASDGRLATDRQHYVSEAPFEPGGFLVSDRPGYTIAGPDSGLTSGAEIDLLAVGKLWFWDPISESVADTNSVLTLSNSSGAIVEIDSAGADSQRLPIGIYDAQPDWHWHLDYFLSPLSAAEGAYAATLSAAAEDYEASEPFLLIFGLFGAQFGADDMAQAEADLVAAVFGAGMPGDANHDGVVDLLDFNVLKANFGANPALWEQGDFDGVDGVNLVDFNILKNNFGAAGQAPEPAAGASLLLAMCLFCAKLGERRSRRRN